MQKHDILVKNTSIIITNYEFGQYPRLEKFFEIFDRTRHIYYYKGLYYNKEDKTLTVPRGIDINFLESLFRANATVDYSCDKKTKVLTDTFIKNKPKNDVQKTALKFILGLHPYEFTKTKSQLCINLNPGAGKTYLTIAMASYLMERCITITSSLDWLNQWKREILEHTNMEESEIYIISGGASIAKLLNGMKDIKSIKFFLASHNTIKSYGDKNGWDKVSELFNILEVGVKIYDEAHLNFDNICSIDFHTNTRNTLYLTATPARSQDKENDIYKLYFKNVPSIDLFNSDTDPRTKYIGMRFNSHPSPLVIAQCKNQYGLNRIAYINYLVQSEEFKKVLHQVINKVKVIPGKFLFYIGINEATEYVVNYIKTVFPELVNNIGVYNSTVTENKKEQLEKKFIFSNTKSCGAAMDIKGLKGTIVLAEPFKSEVLARQSLGRTRAHNTIYIELVDEGFYYAMKYYESKKRVFNKYATNCSEIRFKTGELDKFNNDFLEERYNMCRPILYMKRPIIYYNVSVPVAHPINNVRPIKYND